MKEEIQNRIKECMKEKNTFELNILKTVLGEIQTVEARGKSMSDEDIEKLFRKFKEGAEETIQHINGADQNDLLLQEIDIYNAFIPQTLTVDEIVAALDADAIKEANNDGQAMGIAMKSLKSSGAKVLGGDVKEAVAQIRS
jgi:uncharacterized protein YqeY